MTATTSHVGNNSEMIVQAGRVSLPSVLDRIRISPADHAVGGILDTNPDTLSSGAVSIMYE